MQDLNRDSYIIKELNELNRRNICAPQKAENVDNVDDSAKGVSSFRNENELKHLKNEDHQQELRKPAALAGNISCDNDHVNVNNNIGKEINIDNKNKEEKKQDEKIYEEFKKILKEKTVKKSIAVRFFQLFMPCLVKKNKNMRLLINLQDFISEELDIIKIIKKLIEYENFKDLFLTENQKKIFSLMQKRILTEEVLEEDASNFYNCLFFKNKMKELKTFKHIVDHLSNIDEENQYSKPIFDKLISSFNF